MRTQSRTLKREKQQKHAKCTSFLELTHWPMCSESFSALNSTRILHCLQNLFLQMLYTSKYGLNIILVSKLCFRFFFF